MKKKKKKISEVKYNSKEQCKPIVGPRVKHAFHPTNAVNFLTTNCHGQVIISRQAQKAAGLENSTQM